MSPTSTEVKLTLRLPSKKLSDAVKRIAIADDRSVNYILVKAIEEYVQKRTEASNVR